MGVNPFVWLVVQLIDLVLLAVFVSFVLSLLMQFGIVNRYHPLVSRINNVLDRVLDPIFSRVRGLIPAIAGIDFSPLIVIFGLQFLQRAIIFYIA
ncbi:MAG: YggT family protein [Alphaproteobacteria bacterium]|nr:MAG: YggT family protein [Alphaproteobacteria bacterium]